MGQAADPGDGPFEADPEAAVPDRPVLPDVEVPLEGADRKVMLLYPFQKKVVVVDPLAAADDLSVALGREDIHAQRQLGSCGSGSM